jgi:hypothetical protein
LTRLRGHNRFGAAKARESMCIVFLFGTPSDRRARLVDARIKSGHDGIGGGYSTNSSAVTLRGMIGS